MNPPIISIDRFIRSKGSVNVIDVVHRVTISFSIWTREKLIIPIN